MSYICPTFEMSTKRNTSKTQVMKVKEAVKLINEAKKFVAIVVTRVHDGDVQGISITKSQALNLVMGYDRDDKVRVKLVGYDTVHIG